MTRKNEVMMKHLLIIFIIITFLFSCESMPDVNQNTPVLDMQIITEPEAIEEIIEDEEQEPEETEMEQEIPEIMEEEFEELFEDELEGLTEEITEENEFDLDIEEFIIEVIEPIVSNEIDTVQTVDISDSLEEKIDELHQLILELQDQIAQLQTQPTSTPTPTPPASTSVPTPPTPTPTPPASTPVPTPPTPTPTPDIEPEEQVFIPLRDPPPPVRETPSAPRPHESIIIPDESQIVFSRVVRATVGQLIEIPFRGSGWVFLGELASRRGVVYDSRRNDPEGLSFIFRAEEAGTYVLKFSRNDFIRDYILNDHVQIIIGDAPNASTGWFTPGNDRGRVTANPRWPSASEEAEILGGRQPAAETRDTASAGLEQRDNASVTSFANDTEQFREYTGTLPDTALRDPVNISEVIQGSDGSRSGPPNLPVYEPPPLPPGEIGTDQPPQSRDITSAVTEQVPEPQIREEIIPRDQLVQRAKEAFEAGNFPRVIALLDQYTASFPAGSHDDELYWLYAQSYEANSPVRDILKSLDYYRRLTHEFPQSSRFNDARRRIAYLERFYINIQ